MFSKISGPGFPSCSCNLFFYLNVISCTWLLFLKAQSISWIPNDIVFVTLPIPLPWKVHWYCLGGFLYLFIDPSVLLLSLVELWSNILWMGLLFSIIFLKFLAVLKWILNEVILCEHWSLYVEQLFSCFLFNIKYMCSTGW